MEITDLTLYTASEGDTGESGGEDEESRYWGGGWSVTELIANPMSIYDQYEDERTALMGPGQDRPAASTCSTVRWAASVSRSKIVTSAPAGTLRRVGTTHAVGRPGNDHAPVGSVQVGHTSARRSASVDIIPWPGRRRLRVECNDRVAIEVHAEARGVVQFDDAVLG